MRPFTPYLRRGILGLTTYLLITSVHAAPVFTAGFAAPTNENDPFFSNVIGVMKAAAADLNIELKIAYADRSASLYAKRRGLNIIHSYQPDYFLSGSWAGGARYHLPAAEEHNIKSFVFNSPIIDSKHFPETKPRNSLKHWIGQMTPNNYQGSYALTGMVLDTARRLRLAADDGKIHVVALSGSSDDVSAIERLAGMNARIEEDGDAVVKQTVLAGWSRETAYQETRKLLTRLPNTSVIWSASDFMAQGAAKAAESVGRKPGKDILIGGFDWNKEALRDIDRGRITASAGGHFLEAAWALILLYDYHHGVDFADDPGVTALSPMHVLTSENIESHLQLLADTDWDNIDFTRLSKVHNPQLKRYNFSPSALLASLEGKRPAGK